jgi:hypothetical protein
MGGENTKGNRMFRLGTCLTLALCAAVLNLSFEDAARAQEAAAAAKPPEAAPAPPAPHPLVEGMHLGALVGVGQQSMAIATLNVDALMLGMGVGLTYNGNGLSATETTDKFSFNTLAYASYAVINRAPFVLHPEVAWIATWAPGNVLNTNTFSPGLGFGVAPWAAPVLLDSAWNLNITLQSGQKAVTSIASPTLRIVFVLN